MSAEVHFFLLWRPTHSASVNSFFAVLRLSANISIGLFEILVGHCCVCSNDMDVVQTCVANGRKTVREKNHINTGVGGGSIVPSIRSINNASCSMHKHNFRTTRNSTHQTTLHANNFPNWREKHKKFENFHRKFQ